MAAGRVVFVQGNGNLFTATGGQPHENNEKTLSHSQFYNSGSVTFPVCKVCSRRGF
ncbi:hypothetical protein SEA27A368_39620 [Salmonella enterica]|nr:hypothetical protein SEA27A368_39620 [Salmonella enterica]